MWIINRLIVIVTVTGLVFYAASTDQNADQLLGIIVTALAALLTSFLLFLDKIFKGLNGEQTLYISTGVFVGLIAGYFLQQIFISFGLQLPGLPQLIYLLPVVFFGFVGSRFQGFSVKGVSTGEHPEFKAAGGSRAKLLDTSVIIDGRILDIAETHFIDGPFIIPNFVLREIQLISDSPDPIKRNRGRRGLEMLNNLQQRKDLEVKISYLDYTDTREVDQKLVKASLETGAQLVTNDFNLNKVAELQGVEVLNLNNLTNALKPVVLPGEDILIDIIKEGKDENQGIGYLEDGTMVVVENGGAMLGKTVKVNVTSIIQTAAGKMIFTRAHGPVEDTDSSRDDLRGDRNDRGDGNNGSRRGGRRRGGRGRGSRSGGKDGDESEKPAEGSRGKRN